MKSRSSTLITALAIVLFAAPLTAQTLEGQVVEGFQGTATYTIVLNGPPIPNGMLQGFEVRGVFSFRSGPWMTGPARG